jgi:hypothetical protein
VFGGVDEIHVEGESLELPLDAPQMLEADLVHAEDVLI